MLRSANLALKFLLELASVAASLAWGADVGDGEWSLLLAVVLGAAAVMLWGPSAPKSRSGFRASGGSRSNCASSRSRASRFLGLALHVLAAVFGAGVLINAALLSTFGDWRE